MDGWRSVDWWIDERWRGEAMERGGGWRGVRKGERKGFMIMGWMMDGMEWEGCVETLVFATSPKYSFKSRRLVARGRSLRCVSLSFSLSLSPLVGCVELCPAGEGHIKI